MLATSPQNSPVYSVNERSRRIRARTPAANSIAAKEGTKGKQKTFQNTGETREDERRYFVFGSVILSWYARGARNEETRIITNRVFNVEQTEETQEHR